MTTQHAPEATALPIDHDGFVAGDNGPLGSPHRIGTLYVGQGPGRVSRRVAVVRCDCGRRIECESHWANACPCGAEYGGGGERLLPRELWGEDTGESFGPGQGSDRKPWSDD